MKVKFVRDTEQFSLTSPMVEYKTDIYSAVLFAKKCKVNAGVCLAQVSMHINNMYFTIKRVECKVFTISSGSLSAFKEDIIFGQPK